MYLRGEGAEEGRLCISWEGKISAPEARGCVEIERIEEDAS
jgi:hypothetical protein